MSDVRVTVITPPAKQVTTVIPPAQQQQTALFAGQGPAGPAGPQGDPGQAVMRVRAGSVLNGHRAVAFGSDGRLVHASADTLDHIFAFAGVIENAAVIDELVDVHASDVITFSGWNWTTGPVFLGLDGQLTQALPSGAIVSMVIGRGEGTRLFVNIQPPVAL